MKIDLNKIEFDMNEFGALLLQDKDFIKKTGAYFSTFLTTKN